MTSRRTVNVSSIQTNEITVELDSHADTCVVGPNSLIFHEHDRYVMVNGFDPSMPAMRAKIVDAAVLYVDQLALKSYILLVNQAILVPGMSHVLLCPMQCRMNGVDIDEKPRFLLKNPTVSNHSITLIDSHDQAHPLLIPLQLEGLVISQSRSPHQTSLKIVLSLTCH